MAAAFLFENGSQRKTRAAKKRSSLTCAVEVKLTVLCIVIFLNRIAICNFAAAYC
jgi:hypothetical protein